MTKREIFFDVETKKLFSDISGFDPGDLGVSISSVYIREVDINNMSEINGEMISFWEKDFPSMWPYFQEADRIIGFNTIGFDLPALQPYTDIPLKKLNNFDILDEVKKILGHRLSLNALATETLDAQKTDVGVNAVYYWQDGGVEALEKLQKYCEADVILTKDLYDYAMKNGELKYKDKWNTQRQVKIDFSYPMDEDTSEEQTGLF